MLLTLVRQPDARREQAVGVAGSRHYHIWRRRMHMAGMAVAFDQGCLAIRQKAGCKLGVSDTALRPWARACHCGLQDLTLLAGTCGKEGP